MTDYVVFGPRQLPVRRSCVTCRWGCFPPVTQYDDKVTIEKKQKGLCLYNPPDVAGHRPPVYALDFCSLYSEESTRRL